MVRAVSVYNRDRVIKMGKKMRNKALVGAVLFSVIILVVGVFNVVYAIIGGDKPNWIATALGGVVIALSFFPVYKAIKTNRKNVEDTIKGMRLDRGELTLDFTIKERRIDIIATQNGKVQNETLMIKNVTDFKVDKIGVAICVGDDMYYIENEDIVVGNRQSLLKIFKNAGFNIKDKDLR